METLLPFSLSAVGVLSVSVIGLLIYYFYFYFRLAFYKVQNAPVATGKRVPVSVVICAKNEEDNLIKNLPKLFSQNYPEFQVVVVNDGSVDDSKDILEAFQKKYPKLHVINLEESHHHRWGKKLPLMLGIKGAKYEHVLLTDADCEPTSDEWISLMTAPFTQGTNLVLGYSPVKRENGFLNLLIRFDNFTTGQNYLSFSMGGATYMGVGRNLAYTKDLFFGVGGFKKHYHIISGDDDLFVNEVSHRAKAATIVNPDAFIETKGKDTFEKWFRQKQRHYTTVKYYKASHRTLLTFPPLLNVLFYASAISLLFLPGFQFVGLGTIAGKWLMQIFINFKTSQKLGNRDAALLSPFLEIVMLVINPIIYFAQLYNRTPGWR